jgi:hypothetical protein
VKIKWYIGVLIAAISCFVVQQHIQKRPNQEMVLTFSTVDSADSHKATVASIESQLLQIGAEHISIDETVKGSLKISYYSSLNLPKVKSILFTTGGLENLKASCIWNGKDDKTPVQDLLLEIQIDFYELKDQKHSGMDHEGLCYIQLKQNYDRSPQVHFLHLAQVLSYNYNSITAIDLKVCDHTSLTIENSLFIIPEVRAGPLS